MSAVSSRNTKAEILRAYNNLQADYKKLQTDLKAARSKSGGAPRAAAASTAKVDASSVGGIVGGLVALRSGFGDSSSVLQQSLVDVATKLESIRAEADDITDSLLNLHGIEVDEDTLTELISSYTEKHEAAEESLKERQEALTEELKTKRDAWNKEKEEQASLVKERNEELKKARRRASDEFKYELQRERALDEDAYQQEIKAFQKELDELKEAKEKEWKEIETDLKDREKEYKELQKQADAFPTQLAEATKKAADEGAGIAKRQARVRADLIQKEQEGKARVYQLRIKSLEDTLAKQSKQITDLSAQLSGAMRQAQDLAVKAIEGASNATSFQAIKEIALEQAKTPQKGK